jgi:hypothetical protein
VSDPLLEARPTRTRLLARAKRPRKWREIRRAVPRFRRALCSLALAVLSGAGSSPSSAGDDVEQQMQGLDEQVQEIKSDVLGIAAELSLLEERLLYPSDTQVAVFVSLAEGETFRLDSVQIQIDGAPVAHHIYSFKELEALQKGGVQRIYTGNLPTGEHRLEVSVAGKVPGGRDASRSERFTFSKDVGPKLVGITLGGGGSGGGPHIQLGGS